MEPHSNAHIPDGLLATMTLLSEKPRHGVTSWESALQSGINERNSTALLGLQFRCSESASDLVDAPNNPAINCNTVLPNGNTLGSVIREQRALMATTYSTMLDSNIGRRYGSFLSIALPNGPIDFKKGQTGQTFVQMGLAGNFAYYAIGSGFFNPSTLDAGAGAYGLTAAAFFPHSTVHFSDLTGNFFSDSAAAQMRGPGLAANGCSVP